jgi:hypothetical protein
MNLELYFSPGACYAERLLQAPPVAAAAARERIRLDTYKS